MSDFNDPKFKKYKMLFKMHLPEGAIRQKMGADGLADLADEFIDFINSPEAKLESSSGANNNGGGGSGGGGSGGGGGGGGGAFKIKDDPKFSKYFRMLKMHLPRGAVEQKMAADGVDISILDEDPESISPNSPPGSTLEGNGGGDAGGDNRGTGAGDRHFSSLADSSDGSLMIQRTLPSKNELSNVRLHRDQFILTMCIASRLLHVGGNSSAAVGVTPPMRNETHRASNGVPTSAGDQAAPTLKLKDDPAFLKYFKMLKMHLPRGAVEQKIIADGLDPEFLDMDPEGPSPNTPQTTSVDTGTGGSGARDDPKMMKYVKMAKLHLPAGAIRQKMSADGIPEYMQDEFFDEA